MSGILTKNTVLKGIWQLTVKLKSRFVEFMGESLDLETTRPWKGLGWTLGYKRGPGITSIK